MINSNLNLINAQHSTILNLENHHCCNVKTTQKLGKITIMEPSNHSEGLGEVYLMEPSESAKRLLDTITLATGLDKGSVILKASNVDIALAVLDGKKRYILINELAIIDSESNIDNRWQLYFLIAHELAHHALGHTLDDEGSRHQYELKADEFAGFALAKLGATLEQALSVTVDFEEDETSTHPPQAVRKVQITIGWKNGKEGIKPYRREDKTINEIEKKADNFSGCTNRVAGKVNVKNHTAEVYYIKIEANTGGEGKVEISGKWGNYIKTIVVKPNQEVSFGATAANYNYYYEISLQTSYGHNQIPYKTGYFDLEQCQSIIINIE